MIEKAIGNPEIHVQIVNGHVMLEGFAASFAERDRAKIIAQRKTA
jgi:osmotically-inducible protein OsmY